MYVNMLRNHSNTDIDDGPHTLLSVIHSPDITILRPRHSLSLISNSLEISQSPTRALIQEPDKSQCSVLNTYTPCPAANIENKSSFYTLAPPEISTNTYPTNDGRIQQFSGNLQSVSEKLVEKVTGDKNMDKQILEQSAQTFPVLPTSNTPELLCELSPGLTIHKDNPISKTTSHLPCKHVPPGSSIFSSSDKDPGSSVYSKQFFSFVIFHAPEDQMLATRVCNDLESLGVGKGTTFCEGFETPGASPLTCLENAVENSAYIILLITNAFLQATWGDFQSTTAMMNSIEKAHKRGSVIPFYPGLNKPNGKIPMWIKSIIPLAENSPNFETKVRNTFKRDVIINHYEIWKREIEGTATDLPQQNISVSVLHWPMGDTTVTLPQQTGPVINGQTPVIQISHARNVQIGNQNSMNIKLSPNVPEMDFDTTVFQKYENEAQN